MERSVGERAANAGQPCRRGVTGGKISALEEANGEYQIELSFY